MKLKSGRRTRRMHNPAFKARVALAHEFKVHPNQITDWKRQLFEGAADVFDGGKDAAKPVDLAPLSAKVNEWVNIR
jgi:transposase-like protein